MSQVQISISISIYFVQRTKKYNEVTKEQDNKAYGML